MLNDKNELNEKYYPIAVFGYNRFNNFRELIESIQKNKEHIYTDLYIFIDGVKNQYDIESNNKIIEYSYNIKGFKSINIEVSKSNKGLANSIICGVSKIINQRGSVIVLEDDLKVSNTFIKYMNEAIRYYKNEKKVFSISGYCPNISIDNDDVFFFPRIESWGWATWKDRWDKVDWSVQDYNEFINNKAKINEFNMGGNDLTNMLKMQQEGKVDSWAIRFCYAEYKNKSYTVYPPKSLVYNAGCNESGTNFKEKTNKYDVTLYDEFVPNLVPYEKSIRNYSKMLNFYNNTRIIDYLRRIKNKIYKLLH